MSTFLGVDLGWFGKPTGVASGVLEGDCVRLRSISRLTTPAEILQWIDDEAGPDCVCAVDAPLVIPNASGIRQGERELNAVFRRHHAGCHPANLARPFAPYVTAFSRALETAGFRHGPEMPVQTGGRWQMEVHPHAAAVAFFGLDRIVKYKKGRRAERALELNRLRGLVASRLDPGSVALLPAVPETGLLKVAEDQIDAALCVCVAANWWRWGRERNSVFGSTQEGYIIVPRQA
ncbi:MAG: DUF429 domain-containing protein [Bryobacteraceae bacterium]|nr:DUF429 domain-containing protein [Bryobacteraceae bacterium]